MATLTRFEELEAWKLAREITSEIYDICRGEAFSKDFGLRNQISRSSVSIMSNIAEGFERDGRKEFVNFLSIAKGSLGEVRAQLYVALDQKYISRPDFDRINKKCRENGRIIAGLMKYLAQTEITGQKFRVISSTDNRTNDPKTRN